jgi:hypothetical protein
LLDALSNTKEKRMVVCMMCNEEREGLYHLTKRGLVPHDDGICEPCWFSFNTQVKVPGTFSDTFTEEEQKFLISVLTRIDGTGKSKEYHQKLFAVIQKLKSLFETE